MNIRRATEDYEEWLGKQLVNRGGLDKSALKKKKHQLSRVKTATLLFARPIVGVTVDRLTEENNKSIPSVTFMSRILVLGEENPVNQLWSGGSMISMSRA